MRGEWVQERVVVDEKKPYSYECGGCGELLWVVDTDEGKGSILNMHFVEAGKWVEEDGGEWRRGSTGIPLPWVGGGQWGI